MANNGKLWVELIIVASWDAVATVNVLTANNKSCRNLNCLILHDRCLVLID